MPSINLILTGFPGKSNRGYLGWSSIVLIKGEKKILFDTGSFGVRDLIIEKLKEFNLEPEDIDILIISHCHWDHMANYSLFPRADYLVSKKELDYALSDKSKGDIHVAIEMIQGLSTLRRLKVIEKDSEIDHGVKILFAPGHTPGLISLLVDSPEGRYVLASDAIKNRAEYFSGEFDITMDEKVSKETLSRLRKLSDFIIPGHDSPFRSDGTLLRPYSKEEIEIYAKFSRDPSEVTTFCLKRGIINDT